MPSYVQHSICTLCRFYVFHFWRCWVSVAVQAFLQLQGAGLHSSCGHVLVATSLVAKHRLGRAGTEPCGTGSVVAVIQARWLRGTWGLPWSGIKPVPPAWQAGSLPLSRQGIPTSDVISCPASHCNRLACSLSLCVRGFQCLSRLKAFAQLFFLYAQSLLWPYLTVCPELASPSYPVTSLYLSFSKPLTRSVNWYVYFLVHCQFLLPECLWRLCLVPIISSVPKSERNAESTFNIYLIPERVIVRYLASNLEPMWNELIKWIYFWRQQPIIANKWRYGNLELCILEVTKPKTVPVVGFERTAKLQNRFFFTSP